MDNKRVKEYFNRNSTFYYYNYSNPQGRYLHDKYLQYIMPLVRDKRVLEIGCGPANLLSEIEKLSRMSIGIDFSTPMLEIANKNKTGYYLLKADASGLPFKNHTFDLIYLVRTLQHIPDRDRVLQEINLALSQNGFFLFDFINIYNPAGFIRHMLSGCFDFIYLKADNIRELRFLCAKNGFAIQDVHPLQFFLDYANIVKYSPPFLVNYILKIAKSIETVQVPCLSNFALRFFVITKKMT